MSRHKAYGLNPRDCLKTTLFQKWQRMVAPPGKGTVIILDGKLSFSIIKSITAMSSLIRIFVSQRSIDIGFCCNGQTLKISAQFS